MVSPSSFESFLAPSEKIAEEAAIPAPMPTAPPGAFSKTLLDLDSAPPSLDLAKLSLPSIPNCLPKSVSLNFCLFRSSIEAISSSLSAAMPVDSAKS